MTAIYYTRDRRRGGEWSPWSPLLAPTYWVRDALSVLTPGSVLSVRDADGYRRQWKVAP